MKPQFFIPAALTCISLALGGCPKQTTEAPSEPVKAPAPEEKAANAPTAADAPTAANAADQKAPDKFAVRLETTKGDIVIDVTREWAPRGADRFHELVQAGYLTDVAFFRVIKGFMAQVGISGNPALNTEWREKKIPDDPPKQSNTVGMVSFATSGPNSRTTQFFINFGDNSRLDGMGFSPFGKVRDMAPVNALYAEYGEGAPRGRGPSQGLIQSRGNEYLKREFPNLDYIKKATILAE